MRQPRSLSMPVVVFNEHVQDGPERWRRAYRLILAARRPDRDEQSIDSLVKTRFEEVPAL